LEPVSAAEAADRTRAAQTARVELRMEVEGMGLRRTLAVSGEGVTATAAPRMDMTFELGPLLSSLGAAEGDAPVRLLVDGPRIYVDPPDLDTVEVPGGARWIEADLARIVEAMGVDARGLADICHISLERQLEALRAAGTIEEVGTEEVGGVETTHLEGTMTTRDYLKALAPERRRRAEKALRDLDRWAGGEPTSLDDKSPVGLWVDAEGRVRRMRQEGVVPKQPGVPAGAFVITMELDDFGTKLDVRRPPGDDVFDMTAELIRELR
ncbi:MAG: hypothetical protein M3389_12375, partial [Actinomycetota bacterium]|nr:hypothetical protein [Actinomycetota bacterium]